MKNFKFSFTNFAVVDIKPNDVSRSVARVGGEVYGNTCLDVRILEGAGGGGGGANMREMNLIEGVYTAAFGSSPTQMSLYSKFKVICSTLHDFQTQQQTQTKFSHVAQKIRSTNWLYGPNSVFGSAW